MKESIDNLQIWSRDQKKHQLDKQKRRDVCPMFLIRGMDHALLTSFDVPVVVYSRYGCTIEEETLGVPAYCKEPELYGQVVLAGVQGSRVTSDEKLHQVKQSTVV